MKPQYLLPITIASLALANVSVAQNEFTRLEHKLTVKLSVDYEGEYEETDTNGGYKESVEIVTEKLSNKELLEVLVTLRVIDNVKGWEILIITDSNAEIVDTVVKNKNGESISIGEFFSGEAISEAIVGYKATYDNSEDVYEADYEIQAIAGVEIDFEFFRAEAQGVLQMETELYNEDDDGETEFITAAAFTSLSGVFIAEEDEISGIVTGAVVAGKGEVQEFLK